MDNYPIGAQNDPRAPYNQEEYRHKIEINVKTTYINNSMLILDTEWEELENKIKLYLSNFPELENINIAIY